MSPALPGFMLRSRPTRLVAVAIALLLVGSACSAGQADLSAGSGGAQASDADRSGDATTDDASGATDSADGAITDDALAAAVSIDPADLAARVSELPPAPVGFPEAADGPQPTRLTIDSLGIDAAPIIDVGVETNGAMEVPPADQVGWYRYSPRPGESGSTILAAHIAFDGENGVFLRLADVELGSVVEVTDGEGLTRSYRVDSVDRYDKEGLPDEVVFARSGPERLILVTCGGRFDPEARSYDDNVVVVATPIDAAN